MAIVLLLAALLQCPDEAPALESTPAPDEVYVGVISRLTETGVWLTDVDDSEYLWSVDLKPEVSVVWAYDHATPIERWQLAVGTWVRTTGPSRWHTKRVEVVCAGPLGMAITQEEFVIDAAGGRMEAGLSASELAVVDALGSRSWLVRESVSRSLREMGPRALRLLLWCRRSPDAEVRARADALLFGLGYQPSP